MPKRPNKKNADDADETPTKTPAKSISLYPMSEEEALKRLLRVPRPKRDAGEGAVNDAERQGR